MPAAPRWVRVALVREGAIVAERRIDPGATLTLGSSEDADLLLPGASFARELLVRPGERGPELLVPAAASGRIVTGGRAHDARALAGAAIALDTDARARIELGEHALLIARCDAPAKRNKPALPAAVRGDVLRDADWAFTAFVAASLMAHAAVVTGISEMDFAVASIAEVPEQHATSIFIEPPLPDTPDDADVTRPDISDDTQVADADDAPDDTVPATETPVSRPHREGPRVASSEGEPSLDPSEVAEEVAGELITLGAIGADGSPFGALVSEAPQTSAAEIFDTVTGAVVATREAGTMRARRGSSPGEVIGDIASLRRTSVATRDPAGPPEERRITVAPPLPDTFTPIGPSPDPTDADTDLVAQIRRRMGAVRACYERVLRDQPDLEGRLVIQVTAELSGSLSGVRATEDTMREERLTSCVESAIRSVRLRRPPQDDPITASFPLVFSRNL